MPGSVAERQHVKGLDSRFCSVFNMMGPNGRRCDAWQVAKSGAFILTACYRLHAKEDQALQTT